MSACIIPALDWEVVSDFHHHYTEDDCHKGMLVTDADTGCRRFHGDIGKHHVVRSILLDVPYCSGCDEPLDAGVCHGCRTVHVDVVPLTEVGSDPLLGRVK